MSLAVPSISTSSIYRNNQLKTLGPARTTRAITEKIYLKCHFCDAPESAAWSKTGKPICEFCLQNENIQDEWPEMQEEVI